MSNGPVAQVALGYLSADYGSGYFDADGRPHGVALILPLDLPGVSKGRPLDKIGQRSLPQGEIYFDNVRIPKRFAVALQDEYYGNHTSAWSYRRDPDGPAVHRASPAPHSKWRCSTATSAGRAGPC